MQGAMMRRVSIARGLEFFLVCFQSSEVAMYREKHLLIL